MFFKPESGADLSAYGFSGFSFGSFGLSFLVDPKFIWDRLTIFGNAQVAGGTGVVEIQC